MGRGGGDPPFDRCCRYRRCHRRQRQGVVVDGEAVVVKSRGDGALGGVRLAEGLAISLMVLAATAVYNDPFLSGAGDKLCSVELVVSAMVEGDQSRLGGHVAVACLGAATSRAGAHNKTARCQPSHATLFPTHFSHLVGIQSESLISQN